MVQTPPLLLSRSFLGIQKCTVQRDKSGKMEMTKRVALLSKTFMSYKSTCNNVYRIKRAHDKDIFLQFHLRNNDDDE